MFSVLDKEFIEQLLWCFIIKRDENISMMEQIGEIENQFLEEDILVYCGILCPYVCL